MAEATPKGMIEFVREFVQKVWQRREAIIAANRARKEAQAAALADINRQRAELEPGQRGGLMKGFLERFRAIRDSGKTAREQAKLDVNEGLRDEIDTKAVPNQQSKSLYSTEEIMTGKALEFVRELKVQAQNKEAEARYTDLGEKMGMRVGVDGAADRPK